MMGQGNFMSSDTLMISFVCTCNRTLSVPQRLGGKRIRCTRCHRTISVPTSVAQPDAGVRTGTPAPPVPEVENSTRKADEEDSRWFIVGLFALLVAGLALLLAWFFWPRAVSDVPVATTPFMTNVESNPVGNDDNNSLSDAESGVDADMPKHDQTDPGADVDSESVEVVDDPAVVDLESIGAAEEVQPESTANQAGSVSEMQVEESDLARAPATGGTRKTISGLTQSTVAGVKVYGSIALVCDISGSMQNDLPNLLTELREKFPEETPLLLVRGCSFSLPTRAKPIQTRQFTQFAGIPIQGLNTYSCQTITDAILFAATELRRDTVMFNCDLQDGGSERAIAAFEKAYESQPFRLSGRSLERDAPERLLQFIQDSGGDFIVDPIYRIKQPALRWGK